MNGMRWEEADGVNSERRVKEQWEMESLGAQISRVSTREENDNEYRWGCHSLNLSIGSILPLLADPSTCMGEKLGKLLEIGQS